MRSMSGYYIHILSYFVILTGVVGEYNMTIESVILTWCKETENIFSDSRVAITCFHASSMGNHQLRIVDSRRIGMSRVFYVL